MDAFYFSVVVIVSLLSLCGRCEAYLMNKETDEKLLILAIVFVVILFTMLIVLVIVICCFISRQKSARWHTTNSLEYQNAATFKTKKASPFYGASHSQGRKKESVFLPDYETVGPAYAAYENPGMNGRASRIEKAEEPNNYELLDLGKKQTTSFTNEGYETTTGTRTFLTTPELSKKNKSGGSNRAIIETQKTSGEHTIQTTSELSLKKESSGNNKNGGSEMATTSYTFQTPPAQADGKESSDPFTVLATPSSTNYYESLTSIASSSNDNNTSL